MLMNNEKEILWENNKLPATYYGLLPNISYDKGSYGNRTKCFLLGAVLTISLVNENPDSLKSYSCVSNDFEHYQKDIDLFSKDIVDNIETKKNINKSIDNFIALKNNWDGYDAIPLNVIAAQQAREFINEIPDNLFSFFYDGYPNTHGTISFEWKRDDNNEFFIEIGSQMLSYYLLEDSNIKCEANKVTISKMEFSKIYNILNEFYYTC